METRVEYRRGIIESVRDEIFYFVFHFVHYNSISTVLTNKCTQMS